MSDYEQFLKERKQVGKGEIAAVYLYDGYAYKCFNDGYPDEKIASEYGLQEQIRLSGLPVVRYYESEYPRSIKMDLVSGKTMAACMEEEGKDAVMDAMMYWFGKIHEVKGLNLDDVETRIRHEIENAPVNEEIRAQALSCLEETYHTDEETVLCHMDYHFLNLMKTGEEYTIVDWNNAGNGKAIRDYARSYVLFYEYAAGMKTKYMKAVLKERGYTKEQFFKAVYAAAVARLFEHDCRRVRQLVDTALKMI